jgi:mannose-6-phosphate isomerase-like protein (cupin superfamily)
MSFSRRELAALLPGLLPALSSAKAAQKADQLESLPEKIYHHAQIPYVGDEKKKGRRFFDGLDHSGFHLQMHETILGPGIETHAPHKHEHEEIMIVMEGTLETHTEGRTELAEAGSVVYFGSNHMHNARNAGTVPCRYYVIELRGHQA